MNDAAFSDRHWLQQPRSKLLFAVSAAVTTSLLGLGVIANLMLAYRGRLFAPEGTWVDILGVVIGVTGGGGGGGHGGYPGDRMPGPPCVDFGTGLCGAGLDGPPSGGGGGDFGGGGGGGGWNICWWGLCL
jgi:hypothetical protein